MKKQICNKCKSAKEADQYYTYKGIKEKICRTCRAGNHYIKVEPEERKCAYVKCAKIFLSAQKNKRFCNENCRIKSKELEKEINKQLKEDKKKIDIPEKYLVRGKINTNSYQSNF